MRLDASGRMVMVSFWTRHSVRLNKIRSSDWNLQNGIIKCRALQTQALKERQNRQHRTTEPATLEWLGRICSLVGVIAGMCGTWWPQYSQNDEDKTKKTRPIMLERTVETGNGATRQKTTLAKLYRIVVIPGAPFFWPMELVPGGPDRCMSLPIISWRTCPGSRGDLLFR